MSPRVVNDRLLAEQDADVLTGVASRGRPQAERLAGIGRMAAVLAHEGRKARGGPGRPQPILLSVAVPRRAAQAVST